MMDFLIKHKLINTSQHGFLKTRSCLTNLLGFFEEIFIRNDNVPRECCVVLHTTVTIAIFNFKF